MQQRRVCIESTRSTLLRPIYPRYANRYGTLHGGRLAWWMLETGSMAAMRVSRSYVVLGAIDYLFMLNPGRLGENLLVCAAVIGSTRHTLDVISYAEAHPVGGGEPRPVSLSIQTFVSVDENVRPKPHNTVVEPCSIESSLLRELHLQWFEQRRSLVEERRRIAADTSPLQAPYRVESYQVVSPDSAMSLPTVLDASKLFYYIDQVAAIAAMEASGSPVVTAGFDAAVFASPAFVGDILRIESGLTGVGRTSMEAKVKVIAENPVTGRKSTVAEMYTVLVAVGPDGRPTPPQRRPLVPEELQAGFAERRKAREQRRREIEGVVEAVRSLLTQPCPG